MIRAVLFDAFGTLFRPRAPIHAQVAESYGLIVKAEDIKAGFKAAFKEISAQHPLYGKNSTPPLHYEDWWSLIIERTFEHADVAASDLQIALPTMLPDLLDRFSSNRGYAIHVDTLDCLRKLSAAELKLGIVSNSDPRTLQVIESLGIMPDYITRANTTLSWDTGFAKPLKEIFQVACRCIGVKEDEALMVGDDLDEDYRSSKEAGLQAVLVKREADEADWVRQKTTTEDLNNVETITSLAELPRWIEMHNNNAST